ncbi:LexA/Signal peptidase [Xylaria bambusicola]|uniref:LexA/Signal peptidase n=1 Tax=Xylaria bambusicola TaxID=326684 RepID=UPI002007D1EC|nr:LexA/Signal peptidase [Xylaria bambusicola]KAI0515474.1 LexA/Signal peptidase [Xylaria bambusicola]
MPFLGHPFRVLFATAQTFALAHVVWAYGMSIGFGWGPSMLPTFLATNEWFVTDKRYRRGRGVQVGDCVVYSIPVDPGEEGLKRVMGMPGDYVLLNSPPSSNRVGTALDLGVDRAGRGVGSENMIQVPQGHCYIVGDNLPWSRDSRDFGPIPLALIKGKVIARGSLFGWNPLGWFTKVENGLQKPNQLSR